MTKNLRGHVVCVNASGFKLRCLIQGHGVPTLVIGSAIYYERVFSSDLRNYLQFAFCDHRGFVRPPRAKLNEQEFGLDVLIDDIERIRMHLGFEKMIIVGHSGHAFLALEYAKKFPDHVLGVVMIAVTPDYSNKTRAFADKFFDDFATEERKQKFNENMNSLPAMIAKSPSKRFINYCLAAGPKSWFDFNYDAAPLWNGVVTNMQVIDYVWGVLFRDIDISKNLNDFHKPVFLALGKYDFLTGPTFLWDNLINFFNNITVKIFNKSAHCPQLEEGHAFDLELMNWISTTQLL